MSTVIATEPNGYFKPARGDSVILATRPLSDLQIPRSRFGRVAAAAVAGFLSTVPIGSSATYVGLSAPVCAPTVAKLHKTDDDEGACLGDVAGVPLLPPAVAELLLNQHLNYGSIAAIQAAVAETLGRSVSMSADVRVDPEEGWSKLVLTFETDATDVSELLDIEDRFFALAAENPALEDALRLPVIVFN